MRSVFFIVFLSLTAEVVRAQEDTTRDERDLPEVVVSVNRVEQQKDELPQQVMSISSAVIARENPATVADALQASGQVFVQKSQQGGGSPVLRGFEASRVLLVVDDVRMNNLIYRSGHLQNIITLDPFYLERIETVFGPSSTIYGSDALGGVIHMRTRQPRFSPDGQKHIQGEGMMRFASATNERSTALRLEFSGNRWSSLTSVGLSSFGDVIMGKRAGSADTVWGLRSYYVETINGVDSLVSNDDPYRQRPCGYGQLDILQRVSLRAGDRHFHGFNVQLSTSTDIPRYDRLTDPSVSGLKYSEWSYGPQKRFLFAYTYDRRIITGFFERFKSVISYQSVVESRITRLFGSASRTVRTERVGVVGYTAYFDRENERNEVRLGIDGQFNGVNSAAFSENIVSGERTSASTRYPDGGSSMGNHAVFVSHTLKLSPKVHLHDGIRLTATALNADFSDTTFFPFTFNNVRQQNVAFCGNAGLIYHPLKDVKLSLMGSTGFRSPNVDDLGKIFDSAPGAVIVPNPDLGPERVWSLEVSTGLRRGPIYMEATAFQSWFTSAIVVQSGLFNGQDSITYDGVYSSVLSSFNEGEAYIRGISASVESELGSRLHLVGSFTYTKGRIVSDDSVRPLDHIPPLFGRVSLRYDHARFEGECFVLFNGKKPIDDYLLNGEDNERYALPEGMPAWSTVNLRASVKAGKHWKFQAGIDNLMDINYRVFASGIQAPGRNFILAVRTTF